MQQDSVLRLAFDRRVTAWHLPAERVGEVIGTLAQRDCVRTVSEDVEPQVDMDGLSVISPERGARPKQWAVTDDIVAIFDLLTEPPIVDIHLDDARSITAGARAN